jgi:uncharacterized protein (DUF2252 family)
VTALCRAAIGVVEARARRYRTGVRRATATLLTLASFGCEPALDDERTAEIVSVLARADEPLLRTRPALVEQKYERMCASPYAFLRGSLALWAHDWALDAAGIARSSVALAAPIALGLGDPHPENFGALRAGDGTLALEPNDFDAAERFPFLWDLRRLEVSLVIAAKVSNEDDEDARARAAAASGEVARAAAAGYASAIAALAAGAPRARLDDRGAGVVLGDVFARSARDALARRELDELTELAADRRRLRRGSIDPDDPTHVTTDLPPAAIAALPDAVERYRATLPAPPPTAFFELLDAARELGSGVASAPRVRALLLVRGPTDDPDDDVVLELKELADVTVARFEEPLVAFDDVGARVELTTRAAWARPDAAPLWGVTTWLGLPCQVRLESAGQKTVRLRRLEEERGTPEALTELARELGALLARVHAAPLGAHASPSIAIAATIGDRAEAFADEEARVADAYAALTLEDARRFQRAVEELGPRLGFMPDPADAPRPDLAALYGAPP